MLRKRMLIWGFPAVVYAIFTFWYTDFGGPLSDAEIAGFMAKIEARGASDEMRDRMYRFMETDSGRQFLMLNVIDFTENPPDVPGAEPGESAEQLMERYMEHMYSELFRRACHPVIMGYAVHDAMDLVGVDGLKNAEHWDVAAFMRYRSRRTLMEIATNPEIRGRHAFKIAAIDKTIAYPIETEINLGEPRLLLGLMLLSGAAIFDLLLVRG